MENNDRPAQIIGIIVITLFLLVVVGYQYRTQISILLNSVSQNSQVGGDIANVRNYINDKDYHKALEELQKIERSGGSTDSEYYRLRYVVYNLLGDKEKARIAAKAYVETKPALAEYWLNYIDLEKEFGTDPDVIYKLYEDGIVDVSRNTNKYERVNIFRSYSAYLTATGSYEEALKYLKFAESLDPDQADFYDNQIKFILEEKEKNSDNF